ncbi:MAG: hypothetical protein WCD07_08470 [Burkholderiales bacterium]
MKILFKTILLGLLMASTQVGAQAPYPDHAVNVIVPFPPGGVAELNGRPLSAALLVMAILLLVMITLPAIRKKREETFVAE